MIRNHYVTIGKLHLSYSKSPWLGLRMWSGPTTHYLKVWRIVLGVAWW